jgi:superfamily II DNA or RNA helicase
MEYSTAEDRTENSPSIGRESPNAVASRPQQRHTEFISSLIDFDPRPPFEKLGYDDLAFQTESCEKIRNDMMIGHKKGQLVVGTGGGKTVIATHLATQTKGRVLFIGPSLESVQRGEKELERFKEAGLGRTSQRLNGASFDPTAEITFSTVQMLTNKKNPFKGIPADHFDLVIMDEAHRGLGDEYQKACQHFDAYQVHMSATPENVSKKVSDLVPHVFHTCTYDELVDKYDFPLPIYRPAPITGERLDKAQIHGDNYTFENGEAHQVLNMPARFQAAYQILEKEVMPNGEQAIIFWPSIDASKEFTNKIVGESEFAGSVVHIDGTTKDKKELLKEFREGKPGAISNAQLYEESLDVPNIVHVIMATPTVSIRRILQQIGRGARRGKTVFYIWDLCSSMANIGQMDPKKIPRNICATLGLDRQGKDMVLAGKHKGMIREETDEETVYVRTTHYNSESIPFYSRYVNLDFMGDPDIALQVYQIFADIFDTNLLNLAYSPAHFEKREETVTIEPNNDKDPFTINFADAYAAVRIYGSFEKLKEKVFTEDIGTLAQQTAKKAKKAVGLPPAPPAPAPTNEGVIEQPFARYYGPNHFPKTPFDPNRVAEMATLYPWERKIWQYIFEKITRLDSFAEEVSISEEECLELLTEKETAELNANGQMGHIAWLAHLNNIEQRQSYHSGRIVNFDIPATLKKWQQKPSKNTPETCLHVASPAFGQLDLYTLASFENSRTATMGEELRGKNRYQGRHTESLPKEIGEKLYEAIAAGQDFLILDPRKVHPQSLQKFIQALKLPTFFRQNGTTNTQERFIHIASTPDGQWRIPIDFLSASATPGYGRTATVIGSNKKRTPLREKILSIKVQHRGAKLIWKAIQRRFKSSAWNYNVEARPTSFKTTLPPRTMNQIANEFSERETFGAAMVALNKSLKKHGFVLSCDPEQPKDGQTFFLDFSQFAESPKPPDLPPSINRDLPVREHILAKPLTDTTRTPGERKAVDALWELVKKQLKFGNEAIIETRDIRKIVEKHCPNGNTFEIARELEASARWSNINLHTSRENDLRLKFILFAPTTEEYEDGEEKLEIYRRFQEVKFGPGFNKEWNTLWQQTLEAVCDSFSKKSPIRHCDLVVTNPRKDRHMPSTEMLTDFQDQLSLALAPTGLVCDIEIHGRQVTVSNIGLKSPAQMHKPVHAVAGALLMVNRKNGQATYSIENAYQRTPITSAPDQELLEKIHTAIERGEEFLDIEFTDEYLAYDLAVKLFEVRDYFKAYGYKGDLFAIAMPLSPSGARVSLRGIRVSSCVMEPKSTVIEIPLTGNGSQIDINIPPPEAEPTEKIPFNGEIPSAPFDPHRLNHLVLYHPLQQKIWEYIFDKIDRTKGFTNILIDAQEFRDLLGDEPGANYALSTLKDSAHLNNIYLKKLQNGSFDLSIRLTLNHWGHDRTKRWEQLKRNECVFIETNRHSQKKSQRIVASGPHYLDPPTELKTDPPSGFYERPFKQPIANNHFLTKIQEAQERGDSHVILTPQDFAIGDANEFHTTGRQQALELMQAFLPKNNPSMESWAFRYFAELPDGSFYIPIHNLIIERRRKRTGYADRIDIEERKNTEATEAANRISFDDANLTRFWEGLVGRINFEKEDTLSPQANNTAVSSSSRTVTLGKDELPTPEAMKLLLSLVGIDISFPPEDVPIDEGYTCWNIRRLNWEQTINPQGTPIFPSGTYLAETTHAIEGGHQRLPLIKSPSSKFLQSVIDSIKRGEETLTFPLQTTQDIQVIKENLESARQMFRAYGVTGTILPVTAPLKTDSITISVSDIPIRTHTEATSPEFDIKIGPLTAKKRAAFHAIFEEMCEEGMP